MAAANSGSVGRGKAEPDNGTIEIFPQTWVKDPMGQDVCLVWCDDGLWYEGSDGYLHGLICKTRFPKVIAMMERIMDAEREEKDATD